MKILKNIIPIIELYDALKYLRPFKKEISKAEKAGDYEREREYILKAETTWANHLINTFDIKLNLNGKENLPDVGPVVYVANHQGYADIFLTCAVLNRFQFAFVAKDILQKIPLYGKWIKRIRSVFIKRDDARASLRAIDEGVRFIEKGFSLMIFPEGTRSKGGPVGEFKKGSLRLATKPGVPVIPITISGTFSIFEEYGYIKKGVSVDMIIHPAIETAGMEKSAANNLSAEVEKIVMGGFEKLKSQAQSSP